MRVFPLSVAALLLLTGCNAATPSRPAADAAAPVPAVAAAPNAAEAEAAGERTPSQSPSTPVAGPIQNGFDQLSGRLTLLQEQVLQLRSDQQRLLEQGQMLLNRMQLLSTPAADEPAAQAPAEADAATAQLDAAIGQLMQLLNQLDAPADATGTYGVATTYTRQGAWILLRFDRHSGRTWLADGGYWQALDDVEGLPPSRYRVLVHRADQDAKGYVAVRIDEHSGAAWWLNGARWQELQR